MISRVYPGKMECCLCCILVDQTQKDLAFNINFRCCGLFSFAILPPSIRGRWRRRQGSPDRHIFDVDHDSRAAGGNEAWATEDSTSPYRNRFLCFDPQESVRRVLLNSPHCRSKPFLSPPRRNPQVVGLVDEGSFVNPKRGASWPRFSCGNKIEGASDRSKAHSELCCKLFNVKYWGRRLFINPELNKFRLLSNS